MEMSKYTLAYNDYQFINIGGLFGISERK